ncbi:MAG: hypothetical protein KDE53_31565 [Caldilineaceae bacterium]|nr:hypothetical protein [Caldilineaceae bacterium]
MLPPEPNDDDLLRIADETTGGAGSEGGYLYPANFFESVPPDELPDSMLDINKKLPPS